MENLVYGTTGYSTYTLNYTATQADAGKTLGVAIANTSGNVGGGSYEDVDNVNLSVVQVPEPGTWAVTLLGASMLVVFRRYRFSQV